MITRSMRDRFFTQKKSSTHCLKTMLITIPINEDFNFRNRDSGTSYREVAFQILEFINIIKPGLIPMNESMVRRFGEIAKNSYDSIISKKIDGAFSLVFEVEITEENGFTAITIKDNGCGFNFKSKLKHISETEKIHYQDKTATEKGYLGGERKGLKLFEASINRLQGELSLSNRQDGQTGACICIKIPSNK